MKSGDVARYKALSRSAVIAIMLYRNHHQHIPLTEPNTKQKKTESDSHSTDIQYQQSLHFLHNLELQSDNRQQRDEKQQDIQRQPRGLNRDKRRLLVSTRAARSIVPLRRQRSAYQHDLQHGTHSVQDRQTYRDYLHGLRESRVPKDVAEYETRSYPYQAVGRDPKRFVDKEGLQSNELC